MSSLLDIEEQSANMHSAVEKSIREAFPIEGTTRRIDLVDVWVPDERDPNDFAAQKQAKLKGRSYATPVYASLKLVDLATNKVVDEAKRIKLAELPVLTPRSSFIVKGNEYQVTHQIRLMPGVYTQFGADGKLSSQVNLEKGRNFKVWLDPQEAVFRIDIGTSNVYLYPILKDLGVSDAEMAKAWGDEVLGLNRDKSSGVADSEISKLYKNLFYKATPVDREEAVSRVTDYFKDSTKLDADITKLTLGKKHSIVSPDMLMDISRKLLAVSQDKEKPDDRNHMGMKSLHSVDDFLSERLTKLATKIQYDLSRNIDKEGKTTLSEIIPRDAFHKPIESLFTMTQLSSTPEQINPLHMVAGMQKTTVLGEGGISDKALTTEARGVHASQLGLLDPIQTPESHAVGAMFRLPTGARKEGQTLKALVFDPKTGTTSTKSALEMQDLHIAFPDQFVFDSKSQKFKPIGEKVIVQHQGDIKEVSASKVDQVISTPKGMFGVSVNMIPFMDSNQGNRVLTGSRMQEQALPLLHREIPLVQTRMTEDSSYEEAIAKQYKAAAFSPVSGKVTQIDDDGTIHIQPNLGRTATKLSTYKDFPLNAKHFYDSELKVQVGDRVDKGQLMADTNYTKDGKLALGTNLRVAYIPYRGYNFEDGVVVSETAAKKMTSLHMYKEEAESGPDTIINKAKFVARFPSKFTSVQLAKLDEDGVAKEGVELEEGDPIILVMNKTSARPEDGILQSINRALVKPFRDGSVVWDKGVKGSVRNVSKHGNVVEVYAKTEEPMVVGDKLAGRHGNKGIVVKILPDGDMPRTEDGKPAEVLLNPNGVPSRINPGQLLETAVGKAALAAGKTVMVRNFEPGSNLERVQKMLADQGLSDTEEMVDGVDGKKLGKINIGQQFMMKLDHSVSKKFLARDTGGYTADEIPGKGGHEGAQSIDPLLFYSLVAHGAKENLNEMANIKGTKNDEFWRAYQLGQRLPTPKPGFAFDKFSSLLQGLGVDVTKKGNNFSLIPMTSADISKMSNGEIKSGGLFKTRGITGISEEKGGLFDPAITGGSSGNKWSHIQLAEPMPNPMFEDALKTVLGIKQGQFEDILSGKKGVDARGDIVDPADLKPGVALVGGRAFEAMLAKIDMDGRIKELRKQAVGTKAQKLNTLNKEIRYLEALKKNGLTPTVYVSDKIAVIPPKFRPVYPTDKGALITSDVNLLYKDLILSNEALKEKRDLGFPVASVGETTSHLYNQQKLLSGLGGEASSYPGVRTPKGIIKTITGLGSPKSGFFQSKLVRRRQDLSGRSTIIPEPNLSVDEIGIPKQMLQTLYRKPVIRRLVKMGYTPLQAQSEIEKDSAISNKALILEAESRPLFINRAPSLHKFSMMAFKPKITDGKAIKIHPLVVKGFSADFDGDCVISTVILGLTEEARHLAFSAVLSHEQRKSLERREMAARFKETLPGCKDGLSVYLTDLEDFPHGDKASTIKGTAGDIHLYEAIPGTRVLAYDEHDGRMVWAEVSFFSVHPDRELEIVTLKSKRQLVTDDDPRAVYGVPAGSLDLQRATPSDALSKKFLVPRSIRTEKAALENGVEVYTPPEHPCNADSANYSHLLYRELKLDHGFGYLVGSAAGNGWVTTDNDTVKSLCYSGLDPDVRAKFAAAARDTILGGDQITVTEQYRAATAKNAYGEAVKITISSRALGECMQELIGKGSKNKHLPDFYLLAPKDFREGLFAGLMDTDGSISVSKAKKKPQLMASYTTSSLRLAREVVLLSASLGVASRITSTNTPAGKPFWCVSFSNRDIQAWNGKGMMCSHKLEKLHSVPAVTESPISARYDLVPVSQNLAATALFLHGCPKTATTEHRRVYSFLHTTKRKGYTSRQSAKQILEIPGIEKHQDFEQFRDIVNNHDITWDPVESIEKTGIRETGYDLTVPGYETFMNVEGVVLSNTMAVHVPVTEKAVKEAFSMLPTNNLFNPGTGDLMVVPGQEAVLGLYRLTEKGKRRRKKYESFVEAKKAVTSGDISATDTVDIGGTKTSVGRYTVNLTLPEYARDYDAVFDKKKIEKTMREVAARSPHEFGEIADGLKDIGNEHSYRVGSTLSLKDLQPMSKERDKIFKKIDSKIQALDGELSRARSESSREEIKQKKVDLYTGLTPEINSLVRKLPEGNNLRRMVDSGARGNYSQVRQLIAAPVLLTDTMGKAIATPVKNSYAEGLNTSGYWIQSFGARTGAVDRNMQTAVPGYFNKRLVNALIDTTITMVDCWTKNGREVSVDSEDALDRYTAGAKFGISHNTLVTSRILDIYRRHKQSEIKVRSPLTCEAKEGLCAKCFGRRENGRDSAVGDNVGAMSAQAIGEPATQMQMKTFHTGGIASGGIGGNLKSGFERILQLTELPSAIKNSATLSEEDGRVTHIDEAPAGGHFVTVNEVKHYVPEQVRVSVQPGQEVKRGDSLSSGELNPHDILRLRGLNATQSYLTTELASEYRNQGVNLRPSILETAVRKLTNLTRISDPGNTDYAPGDYATMTQVQASNNGGANIVHTPELKGINQAPLYGNEDWLSQLNFQNLKRTVVNAATKNWTSSIHGTNPVAAWAYGAEFGRGDKPGTY